MEHIEKIPEVGDGFEYENISLQVTEVDGRRAGKVKISVKNEEVSEEQ